MQPPDHRDTEPLSHEEIAEGLEQLDRIALAAGVLLLVVIVWCAWMAWGG